jgi:hypothetical protein
MVYFPSNYADKGDSPKLASRWKGPYVIADNPVNKNPETVTYVLQKDGDDTLYRVHVLRLKRLVPRKPDLMPPVQDKTSNGSPSVQDTESNGSVSVQDTSSNGAAALPTQKLGSQSPITVLPSSLSDCSPKSPSSSYEEGDLLIYFDESEDELWGLARVISDEKTTITVQLLQATKYSSHVSKRTFAPTWLTPVGDVVVKPTERPGWRPVIVNILKDSVFLCNFRLSYRKLPSKIASYLETVVLKQSRADQLATLLLDYLSDSES